MSCNSVHSASHGAAYPRRLAKLLGRKDMESSQYLLPVELAVLAAFMLLPPLLTGLAGQMWFLLRRGTSWLKTWLLLIATAGCSISFTIFLFILDPAFLPRALMFQELSLGGMWLPILPLAFIVVALAAWVISFLAVRREQS